MAAAVLVAAGAPIPNAEAQSFGEAHGCIHIHRSVVAYEHIRALVRNVRPVVRQRAVQHYATCLASRAKAHHAHELARAFWAWRHRYAQLWTIRRGRVDAGTLGRLATLRGCETRGLSYPANYQIDTHHDGAYQYAVETWNRAQGYYQAVTGKRVVGWTSVAYAASPPHQDVVTAFFFPAHASEWACSA